ncbi:Protein MCM10 homolog [Linum grandiflorum]
MSNEEEGIDQVPETPPGSPSNSPGVVDYDASELVEKLGKLKKASDANVEKYSGLRISNQQLTSAQLAERFSDIRFIRLPIIKNLLIGDSISGCWATVGVLTEKGEPRTSSIGKTFSIWNFSCLDETTVPVFLFGNAYQLNREAKAGTVFALLNCAVRRDDVGPGFSLSVYSPNNILKMGTSADYGVCKGKRKDGLACTLVINKHQGVYCRYHNVKAAERFCTLRTELKGGNLGTAFRTHLKSRGRYIADPLGDRTASKKTAKLVSLEGLKRTLSHGERVTTKTHSQGLRFLTEITENFDLGSSSKDSGTQSQHSLEKRRRKPSKSQKGRQDDCKRNRTSNGEEATVDKAKQGTEKMVELQLVDSDEE